ncbi:P22 phage major capsid protein family protein [Cupriavidus pauculus]|uniref:P22 coat-protein 5 family protein n=1 Tax=Cupriavidus pauculus TaxID=82633 RepID=A0A3G8H491_9BURK|nr:P22 phage major capsid protein family protein [Cupriavidus pauculus]AZG14940.1 P22 coat - protein 5 family protein [Cupriavidus pauculus]
MKSTFSKLRVMTLAAVAFVIALYPMAVVAKVTARLFEVMQDAVTRPPQFGVAASNTLTGLIPTLYNALDVVSRELVGFIPAVTGDMTFERAAVGQTVMSPVVGASQATDITPAVTPPNDGDATVGNVPMQITKARRVPIRWNGEEKLGLDNNGASYNIILSNQIQQGMRTLVNEVESDIAALNVFASRAYGTPGTAPFGTANDLTDSAGALRILEENGAQGLDFQLVLGTAAMFNLRGKQSVLFKVNEAGRSDMLRDGITDRLQGLALRQSAQVKRPAVGTGAAATTNAAGYAVGATVITLASAGTGTIVAGDVITFAGDTNKYVVAAGDTDVSNGGAITLQAPGLLQAIPAAATNITVAAAGFRNMFFARSAIVLATRAPALPAQGDSAVDRMIITDPLTGLSFEIAMYAQYRQMQYEISLAWGCAAVKREHIGLLLG